MAEILSGKAIAKLVRQEVKARAEAFEENHGRKAALHVVLVGEDPASQVYVRNKERAAGKAHLQGQVHRLSADTSEPDLIALINSLNENLDVDGILLQLPLPRGLDGEAIVQHIAPEKDVDGLHAINAGRLVANRDGLRPCTPAGCMRMLAEIGLDDLSGKKALVVGRSILVGKPIALMLLQANATVSIAHSRTEDLAAEVAEADVVIAAVGRPELIRGEWLKDGAVVVDVGINRGDDGKLVGDVDFEGAMQRASYVTPVPGGVGPMTIAMLLENTLIAAERRASKMK